jgi:RNA recognition motif. (a.k.a. RRM, RBD, or RNP domain)
MRESDKSKGYGFIYFDSQLDLNKALAVGTIQLMGRQCPLKDMKISGKKRLHQERDETPAKQLVQ